VQLRREGAEVVIVVADDGGGIDVRRARQGAKALGLIDPKQAAHRRGSDAADPRAGLLDGDGVTQAAGSRRRHGRGRDRDQEARRRAARRARRARGTKFTIRLPFTLAITQALIVRVGDELYALPLPTVEGVVRVPRRRC
jgi:chemosensory pili system protein ChpA (sensor histidine kinase/response regulator)